MEQKLVNYKEQIPLEDWEKTPISVQKLVEEMAQQIEKLEKKLTEVMIPGQDLGVKLPAFLGWLGNYGHLPYEKQQELLWELGKIEIGLEVVQK